MGKSESGLTPDAVRAEVTPSRNGYGRALGRAGLALLLLSACVAASVVTVRLSLPETVSFDMKGTVDAFMQQSAKQQLDEARARALTVRFNAALSASLAEWQAAHGGVVLVAPAVVSPVRDITPEIRAAIARGMQAQP